jgi:hypothetical protein
MTAVILYSNHNSIRPTTLYMGTILLSDRHRQIFSLGSFAKTFRALDPIRYSKQFINNRSMPTPRIHCYQLSPVLRSSLLWSAVSHSYNLTVCCPRSYNIRSYCLHGVPRSHILTVCCAPIMHSYCLLRPDHTLLSLSAVPRSYTLEHPSWTHELQWQSHDQSSQKAQAVLIFACLNLCHISFFL